MRDIRNSFRRMVMEGFTILLVGSVTQTVGLAKSHQSGSSGWRPLFHQELKKATGAKESFIWKDGVLKATGEGMLWTRTEYENFVLELDFKNGKGANSGVALHCSDIENWVPNSIEVQLCDDHAAEWAEKPPHWHCGAIFGHTAPEKSMVKKPGQWNDMTVICQADIVYVILNDRTVTIMDRSRYGSAEENPDGSAIPSWLSKPVAKLPLKGHIGLQGKHGQSPTSFRNMRIKPLPGAESEHRR